MFIMQPYIFQLITALQEAATICPRLAHDLDLRPFHLESGVRVTCDVGYLCAIFSLPMPLCSRLRPDVRDRLQTSDRHTSDVRQHHRLMSLRQGYDKRCNIFCFIAVAYATLDRLRPVLDFDREYISFIFIFLLVQCAASYY